MASIKMYGMTVKGIQLKEGENGLFVQMPKYKSAEQYRDIVRGVTATVKKTIEEEVKQGYYEALFSQSLSEAVRNSDLDKVLEVFPNVRKTEVSEERRLTISETEDYFVWQTAEWEKGGCSVCAEFRNDIDTIWTELSPAIPATTNIIVSASRDGEEVLQEVVLELKSTSIEELDKNQEQAMAYWRQMTENKYYDTALAEQARSYENTDCTKKDTKTPVRNSDGKVL